MRDHSRTLVVYEEVDESDGVLKFDHPRLRDGEWHRLNAKSPAVYRIKGGRLQFACPGRGDWVRDQERDVERIEELLESLDPILDRGVIELSIGNDGQGFYVRDYRIVDGHNTVNLRDLSRAEIVRACQELG
jgi:hypothetical protein